MIRLALPNKGRLADATLELLDEAGLGVARADRALTSMIGDGIQAIFVRARDIPEFVADGAADAGVTGWDIVLESARPVRSELDLGFGECRLVVAACEESDITSVDAIPPGTRIATAFPRLAADFFTRAYKPVEIVPVSGATESAPRLGIADAIVDLTSTGSTLRGNGLREVATVLTSTARLVVRDTDSSVSRSVADVRIALESVLRARGMRYLMANVPRERLADLKVAVPGMDGPTISEILNGGSMVAVHAVVPASRVYRAVADIKGLGGSAILVTRIERLMP